MRRLINRAVKGQVKLSTRYGLVGIGALSALSFVHWVRKTQYDGPEFILYLIGVLPNVAAAVAISFVLLCIWADANPSTSYAAARRSFVVVVSGAGTGLIAWEFMQLSSGSLVFDTHDIAATIFGLGVNCLLFVLLTPKDTANSELPS